MTQDQFKARFSWETTESGCWINPTGYHVRKDKNGYLPLVSLQRFEGAPRYTHDGQGFSIRIHRLAYQTFKGRITERRLFHTCGNIHCFNPEHLSPSNIAQYPKCDKCGHRKAVAKRNDHKGGGSRIYCADCAEHLGSYLASRMKAAQFRKQLRKARSAFRRQFSKKQKPYREREHSWANWNRMLKRYHADPVAYVRGCLRRRVSNMIKTQGKNCGLRTEELIGCTWLQFKQHIESQFKRGMSWDNKGEWHIDHIRPLASFNLIDPEEQKNAFHYSNCQPLWAEKNISKSDRWDGQLDMTHALLKTS